MELGIFVVSLVVGFFLGVHWSGNVMAKLFADVFKRYEERGAEAAVSLLRFRVAWGPGYGAREEDA